MRKRTELSIAPKMWAIRLHGTGGPEALLLERIQTPGPEADEALVRVYAEPLACYGKADPSVLHG